MHDDELRIDAGARTDLFTDPGGSAPTRNSPVLLADVDGDFTLSCRVAPSFKETFDAGVLMTYGDDRTWAKLCFEYSPRHEPMVVSVVTRGVSDDCNSAVIDADQVWLRVARLGPAVAFHYSLDGSYWHLVRHFALDGTSAGFSAQSPTGEGCTTVFDQIHFTRERLADLRNGS